MKRFLILALVSTFFNAAQAQDYSFRSLIKSAALTDSLERKQAINKAYEYLASSGNIPLVNNDSVTFLYRGEANSVQWMGDFNGWGYDKKFVTQGKRITNTDIWYLKSSFPRDARLDYKILINDKKWILDPENPHQQWSGIGGGSPNSELRMPQWAPDQWQKLTQNNTSAKIITDILLSSKILGYQINYSVYLPELISVNEKLPVLYVTDGYEYMHPKMGNMITVLNNLIASKKIKPIIVVFIDHREPVDRTNNKRMEELAMNPRYLKFFTDELIPTIELRYPALPGAANRAIMGTSMGGLNAAYFIFTKPEVFSMAGIQSPAFYTRPQIYSLCNNPSNSKVKISMTAGSINDTSEGAQKMKGILEANACEYHYHEVNDGHSWGNWRNLVDDVLIDLFALK